MMSQVRNIQFREAVANSKYPFTENSTFLSRKGGRIPWSVFVDIIFYPDVITEGNVYIDSIIKKEKFPEICIRNSTKQWFIEVDSSNIHKGCTIKHPSGRIAGTLVLSEAGGLYIEGISSKEPTYFYKDSLIVLPEKVLPIPSPVITVTVGGQSVVRTDTPLVAVFDEDTRFFKEEENGETVVCLDNTIRLQNRPSIIKKINGIEILDRPVYIETEEASNLQVITDNQGIMFHRRGDL